VFGQSTVPENEYHVFTLKCEEDMEQDLLCLDDKNILIVRE
jgi:hypothetical protein